MSINEEAGGQLKIPIVLRDQVILNLELSDKVEKLEKQLKAKQEVIDKLVAALHELIEDVNYDSETARYRAIADKHNSIGEDK